MFDQLSSAEKHYGEEKHGSSACLLQHCVTQPKINHVVNIFLGVLVFELPFFLAREFYLFSFRSTGACIRTLVPLHIYVGERVG